MSFDLRKFIEEQKSIIAKDKERLVHAREEKVDGKKGICDNDNTHYQNNNEQQSPNESEDKENVQHQNLSPLSVLLSPNRNQKLPLIERLDFNSNEGTLEKKKAFIDKLSNCENPLTFRSDDGKCAMLRYGEYSPNNPQVRVTAAPYLGVGEYEQRRNYFLQKQKADYLRHLAKKNENLKEVSKSILSESKSPTALVSKAVQTDIQNIHKELVQYELRSQNPPEKELNPLPVGNCVMQNNRKLASYRVDQRLTSAQNALLKPDMDKPKSILSNRRTGSPRERLMADLQHSYTPSFMDGFSYQDRSDEVEREKLKRDSYQRELRMQIEEKRRLQAMRDEQERREQELENRRLEQQLLRMQEEQMIEEQRRNRRDEQMRRHSEDLLRRKQELQTRSYRKHTESESNMSLRNTDVASKPMSHYSPPVSRRNPYSFNIPSTSVFAEPRYNPGRYDSSSYHRKDMLNRMDSLNTYDLHSSSSSSRYNAFNRYDSLSRIDSLRQQETLNRLETLSIRDSLSNVQRRHSATQQDLTFSRKSPKLQRRNSSSRFDDSLPIPVLKAHSPVAKELKNSIPFNSSRHSSDAIRMLEDKWQVPAVQKTIVSHNDPLREGQSRSILTQLGTIRMQLQQEQLRMDETLRKRGITQSKAVDFH